VRRGAIIGFGAVAENGHSPAYARSSEAEIVAVVDRTESRRAVARESIPGVATFATIEELAAGAEIDFVDICTPPALHGEPMRVALAYGWDVLCEKPMLLDLGELEEIRSLARKSARSVLPVHNWKHAPIIRRATDALRANRIGRLRQVQIETLRIEDCAAVDPDHPNWRRDPALSGGGILMDHGWHAIYLARHWFEEELRNVEATLHRAANGIDDEATLQLHFPSGRAEIFLTWRADRRRNTMRLIGDGGEIAIDDDTLTVGDEEIRFESGLSAGSHHADWFAAMLPEVLESFRSPEKAQAAFDEAALCLSVIRRAYEIA
jgi:predicted dehydrogenase